MSSTPQKNVMPAYDPENIFLKIIKGMIPCYKIFETEHCLAILDAFPLVEGHALLIPKAEGYATLMDMPEEVAANVLKELPRLARMVQTGMNCEGVNIIQNNGTDAGQAVFHVHFHVVPRYKEDRLIQFPKENPNMITSDAAAQTLAKLASS